MRILLIAPSSGKWRAVARGRVFNGKAFRFSLLSQLSVAAVTPARHEVRLIDEQVDEIPFDAEVDLVGIGCMTALAPRAYEIARRFRERGVPVVLGGMHPTLCSSEAIQHADAVVAGEAEGVWGEVLADAEAGRLGGIYRPPQPPSLAGLPLPPRHLLQPGRYATINAVQATRGCPMTCRFCSIAAFSERRFRQRPVEDVAREVATLNGPFFMFVDDNLTADRDYAAALFRALEPLDKLWVTQSTMALAEDDKLLGLAARAGCFGVFAGLETFSQDNLRSVRKNFHRVEKYRALVERFHSRGIAVEAGIVFGFDGDTRETFRDTLEMLDSTGIDMIQASIATPLPGTPLFEDWRPRLIDTNWEHYDFHSVVYTPSNMTPEELQAGHDWVTREFYRPHRIARRVARHLLRPRGWRTAKYHAGLGLAYLGRVQRWNIRGWDPAGHESRRGTGVPGPVKLPTATNTITG